MPPRLSALPAEVIQHIASYGSAQDVFFLGVTSRQFHALCDTETVYRSSVLHTLNKYRDTRPDWAEIVAKTTSHLVEVRASCAGGWKTIGIALLRAATLPALVRSGRKEWSDARAAPESDATAKRRAKAEAGLLWMVGSMAALTAVGCPQAWYCADNLLPLGRWRDGDGFTSHDFSDSGCINIHLPFAFCLACSILDNPEKARYETKEVEASASAIATTTESIMLRRNWLLPRPPESWINTWAGFQTEALHVFCLFAISKIRYGTAEDLPRTYCIPFLDPPSLTAPLLRPDARRGFKADPQAWSAWLERRVQRMAEGLGSSGEWLGYYMDGRRVSAGWDEPMRKIRFVERPGSESAPDVVAILASNCIDGIAPFEFRGSLNKKTGRVILTKHYYEAHSWYYEGSVYPFGICGWWGDRGQGHLRHRGLFCLWKLEWSGGKKN